VLSSYQFSNNFNEIEKHDSIEKDIKSISSIIKLRRNNKPKKINEAGHIFITPNSTLAYICREYSLIENKGSFVIPSATSDVFLGTLIWLQSNVIYAHESSTTA
jgi:hypothetical protein